MAVWYESKIRNTDIEVLCSEEAEINWRVDTVVTNHNFLSVQYEGEGSNILAAWLTAWKKRINEYAQRWLIGHNFCIKHEGEGRGRAIGECVADGPRRGTMNPYISDYE